MDIKYDIDKIKSIISDFANITGISVALLDTDFNYLEVYAYNKPDFCKRLQKTSKGHNLCYNSDSELFQKCMKEKKFVSHTCHAGLTDSMMPILKNGIISGYVLFGRVREGDFFDKVYPDIKWTGDSYDILKKDYMQVACFNKSQLESISNLCSKILFENAIEIQFEKPLQSALSYIEENLSGYLSVLEICKNCHVSKNTLYRLFKEVFNCTVNEYILGKRVEKAKKLLLGTRKAVSEIGVDVGIFDAAQFSRTFKKITNMTPNEYRQKRNPLTDSFP